jgi:hypothetical protein
MEMLGIRTVNVVPIIRYRADNIIDPFVDESGIGLEDLHT